MKHLPPLLFVSSLAALAIAVAVAVLKSPVGKHPGELRSQASPLAAWAHEGTPGTEFSESLEFGWLESSLRQREGRSLLVRADCTGDGEPVIEALTLYAPHAQSREQVGEVYVRRHGETTLTARQSPPTHVPGQRALLSSLRDALSSKQCVNSDPLAVPSELRDVISFVSSSEGRRLSSSSTITIGGEAFDLHSIENSASTRGFRGEKALNDALDIDRAFERLTQQLAKQGLHPGYKSEWLLASSNSLRYSTRHWNYFLPGEISLAVSMSHGLSTRAGSWPGKLEISVTTR